MLRGKSSHSLRYGSRLPPLGHSSFSVCVCRKIFSGKNHSLRSQHRTLTLEVVLFKYNLSHQNCLSLFLSLKGTYPHTHNFERKRLHREKNESNFEKEIYDCKIMSRVSFSSLRFILFSSSVRKLSPGKLHSMAIVLLLFITSSNF